MRNKAKVNGAVLAIWIGMILIYNAALHFLEMKQLEYRNWVNSLYIVLFWLVPLLLIGSNLWWKLYNTPEKKRGSSIIFASYCVVGILIFLSANFVYMVVDNTSETKLSDGNYRVQFSTGFLEPNEYYYAEPVNVFSRRRFQWTVEKYADSLSKTYNAKFQYIGDDDAGNPQFTSSEYADTTVTVYGVEYIGADALVDDLIYMVTSSRLKQEWDNFFTHGEGCVLWGCDSERIWRKPVYAVVVYRDKVEETAEDLAAYIKNECETAVRADGKPLYANMNGSIFLLYKEHEDSDYVKIGDSDYIDSRNIPYGKKTHYWVHDANVNVEDILPALEFGFR